MLLSHSSFTVALILLKSSVKECGLCVSIALQGSGNRQRLQKELDESLQLVTALVPEMGYKRLKRLL